MDESSSPIGFGGMKSNDSVVEMHDRQHALSMLGHLISISFNALYAWVRDPRYNNNDFVMDWYP